MNLNKWILNKFLKDIKHVNLKKLILNENFRTQTQTNLIIYQKLKSKLASTTIWKLKSIIHQNQYSKLHSYLSKLKSKLIKMDENRFKKNTNFSTKAILPID